MQSSSSRLFLRHNMPKVLSYTPPWLSRPSPGFQLFSGGTSSSFDRGAGRGSRSEKKYSGHRKIIARRGTEIFVVVKNQIRWSDLCMLKDDWVQQQKRERKSKGQGRPISELARQEGDELNKGSYRVRVFPALGFRSNS